MFVCPFSYLICFLLRKSATSFFAAYDALCEEGTATPVCKALDEVADISVPGYTLVLSCHFCIISLQYSSPLINL